MAVYRPRPRRRPGPGPTSAVLLLAALTAGGGLSAPLQAQEQAPKREGRLGIFRDPDDGAFDASAWLAEAYGFLPLISIITEPAVDYGLAGSVAFFHRPSGWTLEGAREAFSRGEYQPPVSVSAVAGGYTFNNSWMVGGGHLGVWKQDQFRYVGFGGYGSFNLTLAGLTPEEQEFSFDYNLEGWGIIQSLRWRIPDSDFFIGGSYDLVGLTTTFKVTDEPETQPTQRDSRNGALGALLIYDDRDNTFSPNRGTEVRLESKRHDTVFLGDYDYWDSRLTATGYLPLGRRFVLGLRGVGAVVGDGAPFWGLAGVSMRGVPAQRYLGEVLAQAETEIRWDVNGRWSVVGFGGAGWTENTVQDEVASHAVGAAGAGFRYLIARAFGLRGGVDLAWGSDGGAFYITMGSAWR